MFSVIGLTDTRRVPFWRKALAGGVAFCLVLMGGWIWLDNRIAIIPDIFNTGGLRLALSYNEEYDAEATTWLEKVKRENINKNASFCQLFWGVGSDYSKWPGLTWTEELPRRIKTLTWPSVNEAAKQQRGCFSGPLEIAHWPALENLTLGLTFWNKGSIRIGNLPQLTRLTLYYGDSLKEPEPLANLSTLPNLRHLELRGKHLHPESYEHLRALADLETLIFKNCKFDPNYFHLLGELFKLKELAFEDMEPAPGADPRAAYELLKLGGLKSASLGVLEKLSLANNRLERIENLEILTNLKSLDLSRNKIKSMAGLWPLVNLESLNLYSNQLKIIEGLKNQAGLENLDLRENPISEVEGLSGLNNLKSLKIGILEHLERLSFLPKLEELEIMGVKNYSDKYDKTKYAAPPRLKNLQGLAGLKNLKRLAIHNSELESLQGLENLIKLERLEISDHKLENLQGLPRPGSLEYLSLIGIGGQLSSLGGLGELKKLKYLKLTGSDNSLDLNDLAGLKELSELVLVNFNNLGDISILRSLTKLKRLTLFYGQNIGNMVKIDIGDLPELEYLALGRVEIEKLDMLAGLTKLEEFNLTDAELADTASLRFIGRSVKKLNLNNTAVGDLRSIAHLSDLRSLNARGCGLTGQADFKFWPNLSEFDLRRNAITDLTGWENLPESSIAQIGNSRLPLSLLYRLIEDSSKSGRQWIFGDQRDVFEPRKLKIGELYDLTSELELGGVETEVEVIVRLANKYDSSKTVDSGVYLPECGKKLKERVCLKKGAGVVFKKPGRYVIILRHDLVNRSTLDDLSKFRSRTSPLKVNVRTSEITVRSGFAFW